jgi:glycosyltransferase involved in cell wall biosynthesis
MGRAKMAVILPCYNEAVAIGGVIAAFRRALPEAQIVVIDNNSTDDTARIAAAQGARVLVETQRGKGNAIRRGFAGVDAEIYIMADGDGTYDAARAPAMVETLVNNQLDMVVGVRRKVTDDAYRTGHELGNRMFNIALKWLFASQFRDIFSGYRVFSRRFVKSFPAMSNGFEIETEMTVHAILLRMPVAEIDCDYSGRAAGDASKLNKYRDGLRILGSIFQFVRLHRPMIFFGILSGLGMGVSLALFYPILQHFLETGLVPQFPTLIVSVGGVIVSVLLAMCGLILDSTTRMQLEIRRLLYLNTS